MSKKTEQNHQRCSNQVLKASSVMVDSSKFRVLAVTLRLAPCTCDHATPDLVAMCHMAWTKPPPHQQVILSSFQLFNINHLYVSYDSSKLLRGPSACGFPEAGSPYVLMTHLI